jgi:hypothetical protein
MAGPEMISRAKVLRGHPKEIIQYIHHSIFHLQRSTRKSSTLSSENLHPHRTLDIIVRLTLTITGKSWFGFNNVISHLNNCEFICINFYVGPKRNFIWMFICKLTYSLINVLKIGPVIEPVEPPVQGSRLDCSMFCSYFLKISIIYCVCVCIYINCAHIANNLRWLSGNDFFLSIRLLVRTLSRHCFNIFLELLTNWFYL